MRVDEKIVKKGRKKDPKKMSREELEEHVLEVRGQMSKILFQNLRLKLYSGKCRKTFQAKTKRKNKAIAMQFTLIQKLRKEKRAYRVKVSDLQKQKDILAKEKAKKIVAPIKKGLSEKRQGLTKEVSKKANKLASNWLDETKLKKVSELDGVLCYLCMNLYFRREKIYKGDVAFIILLNLFEKLTLTECVKYNVGNRNFCHYRLKRMSEYGLAEMFNTRPLFFVPTVKSRELYKGFKSFYDTLSRQYFETEEYKKRAYEWKSY